MSHSKEREEKNCLNCGTIVQGRYCHVCGQENTVPKETVWTLLSHFFNDITHFDGKFFSTGKFLLTRPGFLSQEYNRGRRASYLHPIRMYIFTSAFFFIIFFSLFDPGHLIKGELTKEEELRQLTVASQSLKEKLANYRGDSVLYAATQRAITHIDQHAHQLEAADSNRSVISGIPASSIEHPQVVGDTRAKAGSKTLVAGSDPEDTTIKDLDFGADNFAFRSQLAYDSLQAELPEVKKAGWWERTIATKIILLNSKYKNDKKEGLALFLEKCMHTLPQALIISLPLFALLLLMLYARRSFYYADHAIFTIHLYCATFILLLAVFGIQKIATISGLKWIKSLEIIFLLGILFYLYKAMRRYYAQGRAKTIVKFILLNMMALTVVATLTALLFLLSLFRFS